MDINLTLFGQTIAMFVFVWFCMKYIWPPLIGNIEERRKKIADGLAAGQRAQDDLERAREEADKLIAEARDQAVQIVDQANRRANTLVEEARTEGTRERERQIEAAHAEIEQERNKVRDELRGQVAAIAVASAERILGREIDAARHEDLLAGLASEL